MEKSTGYFHYKKQPKLAQIQIHAQSIDQNPFLLISDPIFASSWVPLDNLCH